MLAIGIELLTGSYVATAYNDRDRGEWPPHPARFFSALVATWADAGPGDQANRQLAALHWLENQSAPQIRASGTDCISMRTVTPVFVPVNDASIVSAPSDEKLLAAINEASHTADAKVRAKAEKDISRLKKKYEDDVARSIAAPMKIGKEDAAKASRLLPEKRGRQPRTFPSIRPDVPSFGYVWPDAQPTSGVLAGLSDLLGGLVRLGHSSTPVVARILHPQALAELENQTALFRPNEDSGDMMIRWVAPGQVDRLMRAHMLHRETEPRVLPARAVRYGQGEQRSRVEPARGVFESDFIVFARVGGPRLPILSAAGLSRQVRRALMAKADEPISEMLSGHQPDSSASTQVHLAIVPLPFVGSEHADGSLLGVALILPRDCEENARRSVLRAIASLEEAHRTHDELDTPAVKILLGDAGILELQRIEWGESRLRSLQLSRWTRASRHWASATPVALDRMPGDLHDADPVRRAEAFRVASDIVRTAVVRVVPELHIDDIAVDVVRSCVTPGSAKPRSYPRFPANLSRPQRVLVHARMTFAKPVGGPLLVGAGRYQGLGLFVPVSEAEVAETGVDS